MTRRHLLIALLLLPCLLARSALPLGFMWSNDAGTARIVFCPGQVSLALPTTAPAEHAHMHHAAGGAHQQHDDQRHDQNHDDQAHGGSQCPFAVAAVTAPPAFMTAIVTTLVVALDETAPPSATSFDTTASRAHLIRGPPALS